MILFLILLNSTIDSLKEQLKESNEFELVLKINNLYLAENKSDSANLFLRECEKKLCPSYHPLINFLIGENLFFAGRILEARESYLLTASRFTSHEIANDALERLYLIENARGDTANLKRLARAILFIEIDKTKDARDSLRELINTRVGGYALYYLGLVNFNEDQFDLALKFLMQLDRDFIEHKFPRAKILQARVLIKMGRKKEAREVLEELIIKDPASVYAIMAREILEKERIP
ncbi:MAG: tetratricopeptide repeat protein [candidate division WOR-3 bacterium]